MRLFFKRYWLVVLAVLIFLFSIGYSFYQYFDDYYNYSPLYYEDLENCLQQYTDKQCAEKGFMTLEDQLSKEESRDLYFKIIGNYQMYIGILMPLIVCLIIVGLFHSDFSSGNIKNILTRQSLKSFYFHCQRKILRWNLIFLVALPFIFLVCCIITGFNFHLLDSAKLGAQYFEWNYQNFGLYLFIHSILLYVVGILYSQIALFYINRSKNKLLTIMFSYLACFCYLVFLELFVYAILCTNIFHLNHVHAYFNLLAVWQLIPYDTNYVILFISYFLQAFLLFIINCFVFSSKERILMRNEKEFG